MSVEAMCLQTCQLVRTGAALSGGGSEGVEDVGRSEGEVSEILSWKPIFGRFECEEGARG